MRPPVPIVTPQVPQGVVVEGELHDESGDRPRTHRFHDRAELACRAGTVPLLILRIDTDDGVIHLDALGALQEDGVLTVTLALRLRHGPSPAEHDLDGPGDVEAATTVVPAGGSAGFALRFFDEDGCRVRASGSVANGTGSAYPRADDGGRRPS